MSESCIKCEEKAGKLLCGRCFHVSYCGKVCQTTDWKLHKRSCFALDRALFHNKANRTLHQALEYNLFQEYEALRQRQDNTDFQRGRLLLFRGIVRAILFDPVNGDMRKNMSGEEQKLWNEIRQDWREGGKNLVRDSREALMDPWAVWSYVPEWFHREVQLEWEHMGLL